MRASAAAGEPPVDALVLNAGLAIGVDPVESAKPADWARMFDVNVLGAQRLIAAFLPEMRAAARVRGMVDILAITSTAGQRAYEGGAGYSASKAGLKIALDALRLELAGEPIRVVQVAPGMVRTDEFTLNRLGAHVADLPKFLGWILQQDELEMSALAGARAVLNTRAEMLAHFDKYAAEGRRLLESASDEHLLQDWTFRAGDRIISRDTRYDSIRSWMMNHQIHHRGQLSVYLRLLDVAIPGMYGPSADDIIARQAAQATKN